MGSDILSYFRPFQDRECFDMKCSFIYYLFVCLSVKQFICSQLISVQTQLVDIFCEGGFFCLIFQFCFSVLLNVFTGNFFKGFFYLPSVTFIPFFPCRRIYFSFLPCITQVLKFFCDTRRSLIDPKMCLDKSAWEQLGRFRLACIF